MYLIRMLRVSDTFTAGEIPMGRYHVVGLKRLPRFGRGEPSIGAATRPGAGPCPVEATESDSNERSGVVEERATGRTSANGGGEELAERPSEDGRPGEGWVVRLVRWLGEKLGRRRNPFMGGGPRLSSTVVPQQGCLKLEGVQVVRNDLSDTDYEVVPARRAPRSRREKSVSCEFRAEAMERAESEELRVGNL